MSGLYIRPTSTQGFPQNLTFMQFIQTVFVGVSGLKGTLVRPKWQVAPPKQPDLEIDWLAIGTSNITPDANAYNWAAYDGAPVFQRQELIEISCSFYGPNATEIATLVRDGFQIQQNLDALRSAGMAFAECGPAQHVPDLVNERFINRIEMNVMFRRAVMRTYPLVTILSANGVVHTVLGTEPYLIEFDTENRRI